MTQVEAKREASSPSNHSQPLSWDLAIATMFQDEARWLKEWLEYHLLVGVQHFYLYNNLSSDNYQDVLQPYIDAVTWN